MATNDVTSRDPVLKKYVFLTLGVKELISKNFVPPLTNTLLLQKILVTFFLMTFLDPEFFH